MTERSHAELEAGHYREIERNPAYRAAWNLDELQMQMEPSLASLRAEPVEVREPEEWDYHQWQTIQQIRAELIYVRKQLAELQNKKAKKQPQGNTLRLEPD